MAKSLKEVKDEVVKLVTKKEVKKEVKSLQEESAYDSSIPENKQRWLR